ncbi:MAG: sulfatase [Verrucomicrobiaceae bacterium]|nr:MAG: sulfatase [Verrucomicrobiaceae bacterium]
MKSIPMKSWSILLWLICLLSPSLAEEKRPNIVFIFADDWGRFASLYAAARPDGATADGLNEFVRTPNIDRVAKQGVLFRNAHVSSPSCTPCRSALLSGQYFWRTGRGAVLHGVWDESIPSFPLLLRDSGYHIGKSHKVWGPGNPVDAPFGKQKHAFEKAGSRINRFSQNATTIMKKGVPREEAKEQIYQEVRGNFRQFIAAREEGKPFHYWFGPTNTHRKWLRGSGKTLWDLDPEKLKGKLPAFLPDVPEVREDVADYLGEVAAVDGAIGVLMDELRATGEMDNTIIALSGDHGAPGFPHGKCNLYTFGTGVTLVMAGPGIKGGRVVDDFVNLTDLAPTFLEAAGLPIPSVVTGRSLWPVLRSDKAGLVDPARTWVVTGRERHTQIARPGNVPYPQRAIHTDTHLYIINFKPDRYPMGDPYRLDEEKPPFPPEQLREDTRVTLTDMDSGPTKAWLVEKRNDPEWKSFYDLSFGKRPREELYDLKTDPWQMHNLAGDPAHEKIRAELETRLLDELRRTNDPRMVDDGAKFENPPFAGGEKDASGE